MQLVEDGLLDLDKPLFEYLPQPLSEYPDWRSLAEDQRYKRITARLALSHTAGLPNSRAFMPNQKLGFVCEPAARFHYSGEGFNYLQFVVETTTGERLDHLAKKRIFVPLGMTRSSFVWEQAFDDNYAIGHTEGQRTLGPLRWGAPSAAGSMVTTASDYAKLLVAILNGDGLSAGRVEECFPARSRSRQDKCSDRGKVKKQKTIFRSTSVGDWVGHDSIPSGGEQFSTPDTPKDGRTTQSQTSTRRLELSSSATAQTSKASRNESSSLLSETTIRRSPGLVTHPLTRLLHHPILNRRGKQSLSTRQSSNPLWADTRWRPATQYF